MLQVNLEKNSEVPFLVLSLSYYRKKIKERNFTMNKITQDMRFRLSLIKYADKYGVTKAAIKFKPTASTFTAGNAVIMVLLNLCATVPADRIIIPTSIHRMKSSSLWICADVILMPVWSYSG